jgi:hypothetical protein
MSETEKIMKITLRVEKENSMYRRMLLLVLVLSFFASMISLPASGWAAPAQGRFQLHVSLYP